MKVHEHCVLQFCRPLLQGIRGAPRRCAEGILRAVWGRRRGAGHVRPHHRSLQGFRVRITPRVQRSTVIVKACDTDDDTDDDTDGSNFMISAVYGYRLGQCWPLPDDLNI